MHSPAFAHGPQLASSSAQPPPGAVSDVVGGAIGADVEGTAGDGVAAGGAVGVGTEVEGRAGDGVAAGGAVEVGADVEVTAGDGVATGGAVGAEVEGSDVGGTCPPSTAQVQRP